MYVTRPLALYKNSPAAATLAPPEGPGSGILVVQDEADVATCCFGMCDDPDLKEMPFPQNKKLTLRYSTGSGKNSHTHHYYVVFIPVINQPLSSNLYYPIHSHGKNQGRADMNSKEEDKGTCCCFMYVKDAKPQALDPTDIYQQVEVTPLRSRGYFSAKSIAPDGYPPYFLRRSSGWSISTETPRNFELVDDAHGVDKSLREKLPDFDSLSSGESSKVVVVGRWYCPFMFVKEEGMEVKEQMKKTMFYEMTLSQRWEKIYECNSDEAKGKVVSVDVVVETQVGFVRGVESKWGAREEVDGVVWFGGGVGVGVGLSKEIVDRMEWEEKRFGWVGGGEERQLRVEKVEEFGGEGRWVKFGCYVLVERFVLTRMDGSLVLTCDFKNTSQVRCKWE